MYETLEALSIEHLFDRLVHPLYEWPMVPIVCCEDRLKFVDSF